MARWLGQYRDSLQMGAASIRRKALTQAWRWAEQQATFTRVPSGGRGDAAVSDEAVGVDCSGFIFALLEAASQMWHCYNCRASVRR